MPIAKKLYLTDLSPEMYNNEQVSKDLGRIAAKTCQKIDYFGSKFQKSAGGSVPGPLDSSARLG